MAIREALVEALRKMEGVATWDDVGADFGLTGEEAVESVADYIMEHKDPRQALLIEDYLADCINEWAEMQRRK